MDITTDEVIEEYKQALSAAQHQLLLMGIKMRKTEAENERMRNALEAPVSADPVPVGPRVPAVPARPSQTP
jgi:hypothetical protein